MTWPVIHMFGIYNYTLGYNLDLNNDQKFKNLYVCINNNKST